MSEAKVGLYWLSHNRKPMTENSVRHIETLREMEAHKRHFQIRCSHHELELAESEKSITCAICSKQWQYTEERGYLDSRKVFVAEKDD
jgi:hypothetical protein